MGKIGKGLALALLMALAGCYTVDQARLTAFVGDTVQAGMPLEQALVRLRAEEFLCDTRSAGPIVCVRMQGRLFPNACTERVELVRGAGGRVVGRVDVAPIKCTRA
ncbi:MAG: hypothetical protein ACEQSK_11160 [Sphingomonadaceae bacterium]